MLCLYFAFLFCRRYNHLFHFGAAFRSLLSGCPVALPLSDSLATCYDTQQCNNLTSCFAAHKNNQMLKQETLLKHISIPAELYEEILRWGWFSLMSIQERNAFKTCVALVSKTWLSVLIRITFRDIYIPSTPHWVLNREPTTIGHSPIFHKLLPDVSLIQLCQTITRQISVLNTNDRYIDKKPIRDMLLTFHGLSFMPNLRSLAVEYHRSEKSFFSFYASIVQLHLEYTFASDFPCWLIEALLYDSGVVKHDFPWALPELEHISTPVTEDPSKSIIKVLDRCPHLRLVEETFTFRVQILSSSRLVPKNCIIFHGSMPSFDACVVDYHHDTLPRRRTIRGSAPVLVVMKDDEVCEPSIDLSNTFRYVHIFHHFVGDDLRK